MEVTNMNHWAIIQIKRRAPVRVDRNWKEKRNKKDRETEIKINQKQVPLHKQRAAHEVQISHNHSSISHYNQLVNNVKQFHSCNIHTKIFVQMRPEPNTL